MSATFGRALEGHRDDIDDLIRRVRRDARRRLPPGTRYEIRSASGPPPATAVAWIAEPAWIDRPDWRPGSPGFDAVTGTFIHERAVTPEWVCRGCGLELVLMAGALVCICCGGGSLGRDPGCRHDYVHVAVRPIVGLIPLSCEDIEP